MLIVRRGGGCLQNSPKIQSSADDHHLLVLIRRSLSSSSSGGSSQTTVTGPTTSLKSWQSGAKLVKNTQVENKYLDHIREVHDPSQHIKTIEDELKGTIGKALGKQGQKVLMYLRAMEQQRKEFDELIEDDDSGDASTAAAARKLQTIVEKHNQYREDCLKARWELIVHRQAVGFIVGNHKYVTEKFPIGEPLPNQLEQGDDDEASPPPDNEKSSKKFGDQLDWWQTIGRWR